MKIIFKNIKETNGEIKVVEKVYTIPHATGIHYRKLLEHDAKINYSDMSVDEFDTVIGFVCDVFRNQFTIEEFYEGIPSHEVVSTAISVFSFVRTGKTAEQLLAEEEREEGKL